MNGLDMLHPGEGLLLRYADGELPPREAAAIRSHLEACWQCRSELEAAGGVVGECVRYRKFLYESLPAPPLPWRGLSPGFEQVDAALARPGLFARLGRMLVLPAPLRWAALAAGLAAAAFFAGQMRNPPAAQAAELLEKAVAAADARPAAPRRLAIRTRRSSAIRWMGVPAGAAVPAAPAAFESEWKALEALFEKSRYNWEDPLSARSFQSWRGGLRQKRDEVTSSGGGGWHLIRTIAAENEIAEASLRIRASDLHPTEGRFQFRNHEWVEVSELPAQPGLAVEASPVPPGAPLPAPAPEARAPEGIAPPPASLGQELRVVAALQRIGADLGDPVEVSRSGGRIVVSGMGVEAERRRVIEAALEPLDNVVVRLSDAAQPAPSPGDGKPADVSVRAGGPYRQEGLENRLGGRAQFERMAAQILDKSEMMMSRAYALKRLAERFPESAETQLSGPDRRLLLSLHQDHAAHLAGQAADLEQAVRPLLESLKTAPPEPRPAAALPWRAATWKAFEAARGVEQLLARFLGGSEDAAAGPAVPSELAARLADLRAAADCCRRASAAHPDGDPR